VKQRKNVNSLHPYTQFGSLTIIIVGNICAKVSLNKL